MTKRLERHTEFWFQNLKERDLLGDLDIGWKIILKCILEKQNLRVGTELTWIMTESNERETFERGTESQGFVIYWDFLEQLSNY